MIDLTGLFSAFYQRLILRDLFGKIVPGAIFLVLLTLPFQPSTSVIERVATLGLTLTLLALGVAWIAAFLLQAVGETLGWLRNSPKGQTRQEFYHQMARFDDGASELQRMHAERLLVIKEACGNGGMALLLGVALNAAFNFGMCLVAGASWRDVFSLQWALLAIAGVVAGTFLVRWHREHVERHKDLIERFLERRNK